MRKVIDGKRYDTDQAQLVASWDNGQNRGDFKRYEEDLYRTKKGNWFVHKAGGPMTHMAVQRGNGYGGSQEIEPIAEDEAFEWMQDHDCIEGIEAWFPDRIEDA
jgi:hypothetical protein